MENTKIDDLVKDIKQTIFDLRNQDNTRGMCDAWMRVEDKVVDWLTALMNEIDKLNEIIEDAKVRN